MAEKGVEEQVLAMERLRINFHSAKKKNAGAAGYVKFF